MYPMYSSFTCQEEFHPFVEACFPKLKLEFAYFWLHYQARKRRFIKKNERSMRMDEMFKMRREIEDQPIEEKQRWAHNLLKKLKKDIKPESRDEFIKAMKGFESGCVISNPDQKQKMRRIDCLRQADKVWRLDLVMMILFHGAPLESTDGERLSKISKCKEPLLCVNPSHIGLVAKELDLFISKNLYQADSAPGPNMLLSGVVSETDFDQYSNLQDMPSPPYSRSIQIAQPVNIRCSPRVHPYQCQRSTVSDSKLTMYERDGAGYSDSDSGVSTPPKVKMEYSSLSPGDAFSSNSMVFTKNQLYQQEQVQNLYQQHINKMISEGDKLGLIDVYHRTQLLSNSVFPWQLSAAPSNFHQTNDLSNQLHTYPNFNDTNNYSSLAFNSHQSMLRTFSDKRMNTNSMEQNVQDCNATCNNANSTESYDGQSQSNGLYSQAFGDITDGSFTGEQHLCANGFGSSNMMQNYPVTVDNQIYLN
ncbi:nuclear factor 1 B-type [Hydra vulgaris]|uniref:nuclear factor 1 B-type n=1 Tax=Hydra vulgaris TaxID=6087 RepID=UPI0002B45201|nr:nuclear factor 1 B-type [Hydra vulgaris]